MYKNDTITSISTALGDGAIGIVRISGSKSIEILGRIFITSEPVADLKSHTINYGHIKDENGSIIDEVMVSIMKTPKSYTKEDVIEINCHGGNSCVRSVLDLVIQRGARLAEPGEFTKRAFLNGRIDLSQAEAVMDVINSRTEMSNRAAQNQLKGSLSNKVNFLRNKIILLISNIEVSIDYPEHEEEEANLVKVSEEAKIIKDEIIEILKSIDNGKILRDGIQTAIVGKPNVGKSSLLNFLLDEERAIVTEVAGTTRDILQESINLDGIVLNVADTAGIRKTEDIVESIGVSKAWGEIGSCDLVILMVSAMDEISNEDLEILDVAKDKKVILIVNKIDLDEGINEKLLPIKFNKHKIIYVSIKEKRGLDKLIDEIKNIVTLGEVSINSEVFLFNERHKYCFSKALESINFVLSEIERGTTEDLISLELMECYKNLGEVIGETYDDDVVDSIFSKFCLGK